MIASSKTFRSTAKSARNKNPKGAKNARGFEKCKGFQKSANSVREIQFKCSKSAKSSKSAQNVKKGARNQEHVDVAKKKAPENPCPVATGDAMWLRHFAPVPGKTGALFCAAERFPENVGNSRDFRLVNSPSYSGFSAARPDSRLVNTRTYGTHFGQKVPFKDLGPLKGTHLGTLHSP